MTNSTFQGGEQVLRTIWALAIHLLKCLAKAVIGVLKRASALKSRVSHKGISRPKLVKSGKIDLYC